MKKLSTQQSIEVLGMVLMAGIYLLVIKPYVPDQEPIAQAYCVEHGHIPPPHADAQGLSVQGGIMSEKDLIALMYLDFSAGQSYEAIKSRFGLPQCRDRDYDYYQIQCTSKWAMVQYNGQRAVGYWFGE